MDALDDDDDAAAGTIRIMDVKDVLANNEDVRQELTIIEAFPGPLIRLELGTRQECSNS